MHSYPNSFARPYCKYCGAVLENTALHKQWHESLNALVKHVFRPDMSQSEWRAFIDSPEFRTFADAKVSQRVSEIEVEEGIEDVIEGAQTIIERESRL